MATSADGAAPPDEVPDDLSGDLEVLGRVTDSSNLAILARLVERPDVHVIYKPVQGERPLWDFPDGTLAGREVAAHVVSELGGWHVVPQTVMRDGPLGPGSVQRWIGDPFAPSPDDSVVDLVPVGAAPPGWHAVFEGETPTGAAVTVAHSGRDDVRSLAVLDAVINNSDRKGSHCLRDADGRLWAIDHGVTFSPTPKLRTVLWGWAGNACARATSRCSRCSGRRWSRTTGRAARGAAAGRRRRCAAPAGQPAAPGPPSPAAEPGLAGRPVATALTPPG